MPGQHRTVAAGGAEKPVGELGAGDMQHHQHRDRQAEDELRQLPVGQPQMPPDVDRPQRIQHVNRQRGREHIGSGLGPPELHQPVEHLGRDRQRDDQEDVRQEVTEHEREQDEPADQPGPRANEPGKAGQPRRARGLQFPGPVGNGRSCHDLTDAMICATGALQCRPHASVYLPSPLSAARTLDSASSAIRRLHPDAGTRLHVAPMVDLP